MDAVGREHWTGHGANALDFPGLWGLTRIEMALRNENSRNRFLIANSGLRLRQVAICLVLAAWTCLPARAQSTDGHNSPEDSMRMHYEAAQQAQSAGDLAKAEIEYKRFLSEAMQRLASRRAAAGALQESIPLLEEGLELTPNDTILRLDYAKACRSSGRLAKAKTAAENVLTLEPRNVQAHLELGQILAQMGDDAAATSHYEAAVAIEPTYENGYALAKEYLRRKDPDHASKIFAEMVAGFGDTPELRLEFGRAYAEAGYPERAVPEFESALAKNDKIRGGHYSLGAAYLLGLGNVVQDKAEAQFRQELENYPDDPLSLYQLGSIEFNRHQLQDAERELSKAAKLDERNPDTYLLLGQIYNETGRAEEAEAALRKSIALTTNVARNHYQVQGAHYLLARILMQSGRAEEAKQEMKIANELLKRNTSSMQGLDTPTNDRLMLGSVPTSTPIDQEKMRAADAFALKINGAVADSYNNLGAMAATVGNFPVALRSFQQAAKWNPSLEGLDYNWGRAAFSAKDYKEAIAPLGRHLEKKPDDEWSRAALGASYFSLQKYAEAVKTLRPMEGFLDGMPQLDYIYAVSQLKTGEPAAAIKRLEALEKANPDIASIPEALAEAYASVGENEKAARKRELANAMQKKDSPPSSPAQPN